MCFICDGGTYEELHQQTRDRIESGRWSLSGLEGFFPWTYTIGLADHGLPELVMLGPIGRAAKVLNDLGDQLRRGGLHLGAGSVVEANRECLVIGEVHRRQIERGLVAGWFDYHDWAGSLPALRVLQVMTLPTEHPVLSARSLAGAGNPLGL